MNQDVRNNDVIKYFQKGGSISDWWDDRFYRRNKRKSRRAQNKNKRKTIKQCERDSKQPMCKRRR